MRLSAMLKWIAVLALALLALGAAPHLHDDAGDCVLCHVPHTPCTASVVSLEVPEPVVTSTDAPVFLQQVRNEALEGHGTRAPPV
jgi:hypothetical protein